MQEKFFNLPKGLRWVIVFVAWAVTVAGFVGCLLVKQYTDLPWLEIILTFVGMLFCVVAICLTIVQLTHGNEQENSEETK